MSTIKIHHLSPVGTDLFQDSESYLNELTPEQTKMMGSGAEIYFISLISKSIGANSQASFSIGVSLQTFSAVTLAKR